MPKKTSLEAVLVAQLGGDPRLLRIPFQCYIYLAKQHIANLVYFEQYIRGKKTALKVSRGTVLRGVISYSMLRFDELESASGSLVAATHFISGPTHPGVLFDPPVEGSRDAEPVKTEVYMPVPLTAELLTYAQRIFAKPEKSWRRDATNVASIMINYGLHQLHEEPIAEAVEFLRQSIRDEAESGARRGRPKKVAEVSC